MNNEQKKQLDFFVAEVERLYREIKEWVSTSSLECRESQISITEKSSGTYTIKKLTIFAEGGDMVAELVPVGTWVIGAKGRVDIIGRHDRLIIVHLSPAANSSTDAKSHLAPQSRPLFKGIDEAGWYWIEHKLSSRAQKLTAELFFEILDDISDYECN